MNMDIVDGSWKQLKGRVTAFWGKLAGDPSRVLAGQCADLAGRRQECYGLARDEAEQQMRAFAKANTDYRRRRPF